MSRTFASQDERLKLIGHCARAADADDVCRARGDPEESAAYFYRSRSRWSNCRGSSVSSSRMSAAGVQCREGRKRLLDQFHQSNAAVIRELHSYETFLKNDLLPRSRGSFSAWRRDSVPEEIALRAKSVDIPLDRLLEIGYAEPAAESGGLPGQRRRRSTRRRLRSRFSSRPKRITRPRISLLDAFRNTLLRASATTSRSHRIALTIPSQVIADSRRDASVHARVDVGVDGYSGSV